MTATPDTGPVTDAPARRDPLEALRRPGTVRARCAAVVRAVADGRSGAFRLDPQAVDRLADRLLAVAADPAPDGAPTPGGDRWALLRVDGLDRPSGLAHAMADRPAADVEAASLDLAALLALLDAESAVTFRHDEPARGTAAVDRLALPVERQANADLFALLDRFAPAPATGHAPATGAAVVAAASATPAAAGDGGLRRHVGPAALAIAAWRAFEAGVFSASRDDPWRVDAAALRQVDAAALRAALGVDATHPWPGVDARAAALARLGRWLVESPGGGPATRLADRVKAAVRDAARPDGVVDAEVLAAGLARALAPGIAAGASVLGLPAGDVGPHPWAGAAVADGDGSLSHAGDPATRGWVPFHRGALTLVRTLREPLAAGGHRLDGLERLPDASGDRHVAALLDTGALSPRAAADLDTPRPLHDLLAVEARAVAVTLWPQAVARARARWTGDGPPPADDAWIARATRPRRDARPAFAVVADAAW